MNTMDEIAAVTAFWRGAGPDRWFAKDDAFDAEFRSRFYDLHFEAAARRRDHWIETADGALALLILSDQFPRNVFRGTGHMFATDALARRYAREAQNRGHMEKVEAALRVFFTLPFSHSEDLADQDTAVALSKDLDAEIRRYAELHRDIIRRFGRFPHRNPALGRDTTAEEAAFLNAGGFAG
jgi:uncharacterized protein (DUF924 family)